MHRVIRELLTITLIFVATQGSAIVYEDNSVTTDITFAGCEMRVTVDSLNDGNRFRHSTHEIDIDVTTIGSVVKLGGGIFDSDETTTEIDSVGLPTCLIAAGDMSVSAVNGTFGTALSYQLRLGDLVTTFEIGRPNVAPIASILGGDTQTARPDEAIQLEGQGSDSNNSNDDAIIDHQWTALNGAPELLDSNTLKPTFPAQALLGDASEVTYEYELVVYDQNGLASLPKRLTIIVTRPDTTAPTVGLTTDTTTLNNTDPFTVTATFNEDVSGFEIDDILITNAAVTAISAGTLLPDGREQYVLTIAPTGAGDVTIQVAEMTVVDGAENLNDEASNTLTIGNTIVEDTQKLIADFMLGRAGNLASNQPGLTRFMQGTGCGSFNANATAGSGSVNGCVSQGNAWADLNSSWSGDSSYTLGSFGAHGFVNPNLLIGGMLQLDYADDEANNISGTGWMVGPYFVAQVPDQPLFFEGRLLYGQTENDISPLGTYTDSFDTERMLAQLRATGEYKYQATTLMPLLDLTYTDDEAQTYTDSLGNVIPGQKVSIMQVSAGMDFSTPIAVQSGALDLIGGLSAIHASTEGGGADFEGTRGRAELGLNYSTEFGGSIRVGTFYDGIGSDYESRGANLSFDMQF